jgi:hypothetical protein
MNVGTWRFQRRGPCGRDSTMYISEGLKANQLMMTVMLLLAKFGMSRTTFPSILAIILTLVVINVILIVQMRKAALMTLVVRFTLRNCTLLSIRWRMVGY